MFKIVASSMVDEEYSRRKNDESLKNGSKSLNLPQSIRKGMIPIFF